MNGAFHDDNDYVVVDVNNDDDVDNDVDNGEMMTMLTTMLMLIMV